MDRRSLLGSLITGFMGLFAHVSEKPRLRKVSGWLYQHIKKDGEEGWDLFFSCNQKHCLPGDGLKSAEVGASAYEAAIDVQKKYGGKIIPLYAD